MRFLSSYLLLLHITYLSSNNLILRVGAHEGHNKNNGIPHNENELNEGIDGLLQGDLGADFESISAFFGLEYAEEAVEAGLLEKPAAVIDEIRPFGGGSTKWIGLLWRDQRDDEGNFLIPYQFNSAASFTWPERTAINEALKQLSEQVGGYVKFVKRKRSDTSANPFITITSGRGCWSYIGQTEMASGPTGQQLNLQPNNARGWGCVHTGIIQHEMMHTLGFHHEHSRPDRDDYVTIKYENILKGAERSFSKSSQINTQGAAYDYGSVMHYGTHDFSSNDKPTIDAGGKKIGQRDGPSDLDLIQIRLLYQCEAKINTAAAYAAAPCSADCTCSEGMSGCGDSDANCRGNLKCLADVCTASTPSPSPSPTTAPCLEYGPSCCQTLVTNSNNFLYNGDKAVCVNAKVAGSCSERMSYDNAKAACEAVNSRLCTLAELEAKEADEIGCTLKYRSVWTSTPCDSGFYWARGYNGSRAQCKNTIHPKHLAFGLCCSDEC